jgi:hypothetical protein
MLNGQVSRNFRDDNTLPNLGETNESNQTMEEQMRPTPNPGFFSITPFKERGELESLVIEDQEDDSNFETDQKLLDKSPSTLIKEVDKNLKLVKKI